MKFPALGTSGTGTRRVLLAGLGGLLALMAFAGVDALLIVRQLRATNIEIRQRFLSRNQLLEQIRSGIYLSGTYARDILLTSEERGLEEPRSRLEATRRTTESAVEAYSNALDPAELAPFANLRSEIHAYYQLLGLIQEWNTAQKRRDGYAYLSNELVRRRTTMLAIADRISSINEHDLALVDTKTTEAFDRFRLRLIVTLLLTLCGGVLLAWLTLTVLTKAESEREQRYQESVRARSELQELSARLLTAQEEERKSISRELHDEVGQALSALLVETGNTAAMLPPGSDELRPHLDGIRRLAENCVGVIRNMALLLRPSMLDDLGLIPALEWQARETAKRTRMQVRVTAGEAADHLPDELKTCIYRVVQEALNNAARHARAGRVDIGVDASGPIVMVEITDDGQGFDAARTRGLGLVGMEERVTHLGGRFAVESMPGRGVTVHVELPSWKQAARAAS